MAEKTGPSLRDMAYAASYGERPANILQDKAKEIFASYSDQMAEAAAQRRAARQDKKARIKEMGGDDDRDGVPNSLDPDYANKSITGDSDSDGNPDYVDFTEDPQPVDVPLKAPGMPMRSPIKQSLFLAAKAAAYDPKSKNIGSVIDKQAAAMQNARYEVQKTLKDRVVKSLEDFTPDVVGLEGFDSFNNGKQACTEFGLTLKKQIAEKKARALELNPYSIAYKENINEINKLITASKNLNLEQTKLKNLKKEWGKTSINNMYSDGSSKLTRYYLDQVMTQTAPMRLDENGKAIFDVVKMDNPNETIEVTIDDLNKNLFLKVDASQNYTNIQEQIRDDVRNGVEEFDRVGVEGYWTNSIAPSWREGTQDHVILSWIHDRPEGRIKSYKENFADANPGFSEEQIEEIFNYDTADWDVIYADGKTLRQLIYEDIVNYNTNLVENYYNKQKKIEDKYSRQDNFGVSDQFDDIIGDVELP